MKPSTDGPLLSRRFIIISATILIVLFIANCIVIWSSNGLSVLDQEWLPSVPGPSEQRVGGDTWRKSREPTAHVEVQDEHPIQQLMHQADLEFERYDEGRSKTFKETVDRYRREYGRHPPPGFKEVSTTPSQISAILYTQYIDPMDCSGTNSPASAKSTTSTTSPKSTPTSVPSGPSHRLQSDTTPPTPPTTVHTAYQSSLCAMDRSFKKRGEDGGQRLLSKCWRKWPSGCLIWTYP